MKQFLLRLSAASLILFFFTACSASEKPSGVDNTAIKDSSNIIIFSTNQGEIKIKLYPEKAPVTVKNFLTYVDSGFYNDTVIHRIVPGFVIQGGGYSKNISKKKTQAPIKNEADNGLKNMRGTLSMARTNQVNSATSQFFINLKDNDFLDHGSRNFGYAVFAEVIEGMDVVDKIAAVKTSSNPMPNFPVKPVIIKTATRYKPVKSK